MGPLLSNLEVTEACSGRQAGTIPATVLKSRADSTSKTYLGAHRRWKDATCSCKGSPYGTVSVRPQAVEEALHAA